MAAIHSAAAVAGQRAAYSEASAPMAPEPLPSVQRPLRTTDVPGVPRGERRGPLWKHPHHGVVAWAGLDASSPATRIHAAAAAEDGAALGTWAAAWLHGARELDGLGLDGRTALPVVFCPGASGRRRRRSGLVPLRSGLDPADVVVIHGVAVTSPVRTAFDLGRTAPDLDTAVADLDAVCRDARVDVAELAGYAAERAGWKGVPLLRQALPLLDPRARSRPESRMRVVWLRDAGLPAPEVNVPVHEHGPGWKLGEPDLLDVATGLVGEYDGAHHRAIAQHGADNVREETFERHGLTVVRCIWADVLERRRLAHRMRARYAEAREVTRRSWYVPPSQLRWR